MAQDPGLGQISPLPAFRDNYIWLIRRGATAAEPDAHAIVVDPGDAGPVLKALADEDLTLDAVFITHACLDHINGIDALTSAHPAPVYGPASDMITGVSHPAHDGDTITLAGWPPFTVMALPGHTLGHLGFYTAGHVFSGDVLFGAGCGRIKKGGNAEQMFASLNTLAALPAATQVYCAHEYTLANLQFAQVVEPGNDRITQRIANVSKLRQAGLPSLPTTIAEELATNPFLRCEEAEIAHSASVHADTVLSNPQAVFTELRRWKDNFQ